MLKIITNHIITEADLTKIEQAFESTDKDKLGKLSYDQLKNALTQLDLED